MWTSTTTLLHTPHLVYHLPIAAMCWHCFRNKATRLNFQRAVEKKGQLREDTLAALTLQTLCICTKSTGYTVCCATYAFSYNLGALSYLFLHQIFHTPPSKGLQRFHSAWRKKILCKAMLVWRYISCYLFDLAVLTNTDTLLLEFFSTLRSLVFISSYAFFCTAICVLSFVNSIEKKKHFYQ